MSEKVLAKIGKAAELYHRLLLIAAPSGCGKTAVLQDVATRTGAPLLNLNLELSRRMLDLTKRQRALQLPRVLEEVVGRDHPVVLLDNIEILFDVTLEQDPLRLLQGVSRNRTIIAAWNGALESGYLTYATPGHPEYRRYASRELVVICPDRPVGSDRAQQAGVA
ncbi:MAG: BREX-3 system P-loop-containing protein BrxF [Acidobacteriota bacterium]